MSVQVSVSSYESFLFLILFSLISTLSFLQLLPTFNISNIFVAFLGGFLPEEDGSESLSTATPRESMEIDDKDQEKFLLAPSAGSGEVAFVREATK